MRHWLGAPCLLVLAAAPPAWAADDAKAVIEKAIKAAGGAEELAKHAGVRIASKGTYFGMGTPVEFTSTSYMQPPARSRFEVSGDQFKFVQVFHGDKGWVKVNDKTEEMDKDQLDAARDALHVAAVERLAGLTGRDYTLSSLGESKLGDKAVVGVRVEHKGSRDVNLYFDKDSGVLLKVETRVKDPQAGKEFTQETILSDHKKVDGVPVPQKVLINRDGDKFVESEVTEFQRMEKLDPGLFDKP
jgi:hypothetical protein